MTNQNTFPRPSAEIETVVPFPSSAGSLTSAMPPEFWEVPDGMPSDFSLRVDGVYHMRPNKDGDLNPVRVCSPLIVSGICRRPDGGGWGRVVTVQDPDGGWHELILDARDVSRKSAAALNALYDHGLELARVEKAAQSVSELLATWKPTTRYVRSDRLGWADATFDAFTLGNGRVLGGARVVTDVVSDDVAAGMHAKGALDDWRVAVAKPCVGNPLMVLAVSHAFSGPLLSVLGRDGGGFHLRGASSRGKSTLLGVAASVWGAPSFVQSWRGTDNGIEGVAAACNDSLLVLDELHQVEPRVAGEIAYMLANGRGKMRMNPNGKAQHTRRWTVPVLSSGELSLEEHMASGGRTMYAGQDIRLIDLAADLRPHGAFDCLHGEPDGRSFAERMQRAGQENYGVAGPVFVEKLMANVGERDLFQRQIDGFSRLCMAAADVPPDGQVQRVLARFCIAALAGEMATKFGLTGWDRGTSFEAARELFLDWFEARDGGTRAEIATAVERTRDYVSRNLERFAAVGAESGDALDGWRDDEWVYIRPECWKAIHGINDTVEMARLHKAANLLRVHKGDSLQFRMGRDIPERPRVYAVRASEVIADVVR